MSIDELIQSFSKKLETDQRIKDYMEKNGLSGYIYDKYHFHINIPPSIGLTWGLHDDKQAPEELRQIYGELFSEVLADL